jgi:hypothetical protein
MFGSTGIAGWSELRYVMTGSSDQSLVKNPRLIPTSLQTTSYLSLYYI